MVLCSDIRSVDAVKSRW